MADRKEGYAPIAIGFDGSVSDALFRFTTEYAVMLRRVETAISSDGIGLAQRRILLELTRSNARHRELAILLNMDGGQLSRALKTLVERGWVKKETIARRTHVELTPEGMSIAGNITTRMRRELDELINRTNPRELRFIAAAAARLSSEIMALPNVKSLKTSFF